MSPELLRQLREHLAMLGRDIDATAAAGDVAHASVDQARAELLQAILDSLTPRLVEAIGERAREEASHRVFFLSIVGAKMNALLLTSEPLGFLILDGSSQTAGNLVQERRADPQAVIAAGWRDVVTYLETLTNALEGYAGGAGKRGGAKGRAEKDRALAVRFRAAVTLLRGT